MSGEFEPTPAPGPAPGPIDLERMITLVAGHYQRFAAQPPPETSRDYAAHFGACKSALAHLEQLIRLAAFLTPPDGAGNPDLDALVADARAALSDADARAALLDADTHPDTYPDTGPDTHPDTGGT